MSACDRVVERLRGVRRGGLVLGDAGATGPSSDLLTGTGSTSASPAVLDDDVRAHLAGCASCSDAAVLLRLLDPVPDDPDTAWARFTERLAAAVPSETVLLRRPPLGWRVVLAAAAGAGSLMLVPEPLQVLAALGVL